MSSANQRTTRTSDSWPTSPAPSGAQARPRRLLPDSCLSQGIQVMSRTALCPSRTRPSTGPAAGPSSASRRRWSRPAPHLSFQPRPACPRACVLTSPALLPPRSPSVSLIPLFSAHALSVAISCSASCSLLWTGPRCQLPSWSLAPLPMPTPRLKRSSAQFSTPQPLVMVRLKPKPQWLLRRSRPHRLSSTRPPKEQPRLSPQRPTSPARLRRTLLICRRNPPGPFQ